MTARTQRGWFMHFFLRAVVQRKGRVAVAAVSVTIAVGIMVGALGVSLGVRSQLGSELKAYGANVLVSPVEGFIEEDDAFRAALASARGVEGYGAQLFVTATLMHGAERPEVEVMGMDLADAAGWNMAGSMPTMPGEVIAGADVAVALGLMPGDTVTADLGTGPVEMRVSATVERGGPEDGALLVDLGEAQRLSGNLGRVSAVFVRAASGEVDRAVEALRAAMPGKRVKSLRQVAEAEEAFLRKIELLMALVTVVVLVTSSISVSSTMSATVLERLKEIGLMKAMGGTRREIGAFYLAEGLGIGVMGGLLGFLLGVIAAEAVARGAFGTFVPVPLWLVPLGVMVGGAVAVAASYLPLARALGTAPSIVLRGE